MRLREIVASLLGPRRPDVDRPSVFTTKSGDDGVRYLVSPADLQKIEQQEVSFDDLMLSVALHMLVEAEEAQRIPEGYWVGASSLCRLDDEIRVALRLPTRFDGDFIATVTGTTRSTRFSIAVRAVTPSGPSPVRLRGALLVVGEDTFLATEPQFVALRACAEHADMAPAERVESENIRLVATLKDARSRGLSIDLAHLEQFETLTPATVGLTATRTADGGLDLAPSLPGVDHDAAATRWGQIDGKDSGVLRVGNTFVILGEAQMNAVNEVRRNRRIKPSEVAQFLKTPSAFIDASVVDLEHGFSLRVAGIGRVELIDFAGGESLDIDWFARDVVPLHPAKILDRLRSEEDVRSLEDLVGGAHVAGADAVRYGGELIDVSDPAALTVVIEEARRRIETGEVFSEPPRLAERPEPEEPTVEVGFLFHDVDERAAELHRLVSRSRGLGPISTGNLRRTPFPHQVEGIRWMLRMMAAADQSAPDDLGRVQGALLADDMGLGKTYMSLVAIAERQRLAGHEKAKPTLIVAPLSLVENWEAEVAQTFRESPFEDIVVLQSERDLAKYRVRGARKESAQAISGMSEDGRFDEAKLRMSLLVGSDYGDERLDKPGRLVITTYDTLRDYQFSMSRVDWGIAVFDEAQAIKNPNAARTRAAKAIKADFRLMVTGTPVENNLGEFWCLFDIAQPGLLGSWPSFRETFIVPASDPDDETGARREDLGRRLRAIVGEFMLRREKEDHLDALPAKTLHSGLADTAGAVHDPSLARQMPPAQDAAYRRHLLARRSGGPGSDPLTVLQNLRLVSIHPSLGVGGERPQHPNDAESAHAQWTESAKVLVTMDVLRRVQQQREKAIIFVQAKNAQMLLAAWIHFEFGILPRIINGDTAATSNRQGSSRRQQIAEFEAVPGFNVIIMSPVAAGVGLTVVGANHVIHLERHWNPAKEAQATDRVYRIGQTRDVHVYLPAAVHPEFATFDVLLDRVLGSKTRLKDAVMAPAVGSESDLVHAMGFGD